MYRRLPHHPLPLLYQTSRNRLWGLVPRLPKPHHSDSSSMAGLVARGEKSPVSLHSTDICQMLLTETQRKQSVKKMMIGTSSRLLTAKIGMAPREPVSSPVVLWTGIVLPFSARPLHLVNLGQANALLQESQYYPVHRKLTLLRHLKSEGGTLD